MLALEQPSLRTDKIPGYSLKLHPSPDQTSRVDLSQNQDRVAAQFQGAGSQQRPQRAEAEGGEGGHGGGDQHVDHQFSRQGGTASHSDIQLHPPETGIQKPRRRERQLQEQK
jgi:hypothetical protein